MPEKLSEEFAPTGPRLTRLPILPPPPIKPHLFPEEARFALRLSVLAGGTEFAAWAFLAASGHRRALLLLAALRLLRPFWAWVGTRLPRPAVAGVLLGLSIFGILALPFGVGVIAAGLAAVGDLCTTCAADSLTVERRTAAYAWIDMGQGLGAVLGLALGASYSGTVLAASLAALLVAAVGVRTLHDRGTPRSSWPLAAMRHTLRTPAGAQIAALAFLCGLFAPVPRAVAFGPPAAATWFALLLPLAGMAAAARLEPRMPNAIWLPRIAVVLAALGWLLPPLHLLALGVMFAALPAAVARGAGEMERPMASSLGWSALIAGAALGAVLF